MNKHRISKLIGNVAHAALLASLALTTARAADTTATSDDELETVIVTGSRIPRTAVEGPAPVVTVTAEDIKSNGFATVADVMASVTQNLGALDSNQNTNGFSPGAQAVDLRGLGPNHTLVLVNGRRIADYPQSYGGNSNFTDISSIPASLIDRIEILSGSASAVYGSDAISGVINFILKQKADGFTIDLRGGNTQHGGGSSERLQASGGYSNDRLDSVFAVEVYNSKPLWAYQRSFTDSRLDSPADPADIAASPVFTRIDDDGDYIDPGQATCTALASYDKGSIIYADDGGDRYCGSYKDVGYGTLENGRKAVNAYGSGTFRLTDNASLFLDFQAGWSHQISYNTPLQWENSYPLNGDSATIPFFNQATGIVEQWERRYFTIEENGGFEAGEIHNIGATFSLNTGLKGTFGNGWSYEGLLGYTQSKLESKEPALVSAKAQALYLGPSLGTFDDDGTTLQVYDAPISRLYTPLTVAQFRSITQDSVDHDYTRAENVTLTTTNTKLFNMPAGPAGFAGVAEYGTQYFGLKADPLSLDGSYYRLHNTSAVGARDHLGVGAEFSVPLASTLNFTTAGRYDRYSYSSQASGKFTYSFGVEFRPVESVLLRGSFGTGFRAPDLSYLYAGPSGSSSDGSDYYLCRRDEPDTDPTDDCDFSDVDFNGRSHGSTALKDETSTSLTYGIVWAPTRSLQITADYYHIKLSNEVEYQSSDTILREEADCRLGETPDGTPVNGNSALCQQVVTQVVRNPVSGNGSSEQITSVLVLPINAAIDETTGIDFDAHWKLEAGVAGKFDFELGYTKVLTHTIQLFAGDPIVDEFADLYDYVIPRSKAGYSVGWEFGPVTTTLHGSRLGGLPNFDGTQRLAPTFLYNASVNYKIAPRADLTFIVDNLFDTRPARDSTWTSYPYYSRSWFSPVGRAFFLEFSMRVGGSDAQQP